MPFLNFSWGRAYRRINFSSLKADSQSHGGTFHVITKLVAKYQACARYDNVIIARVQLQADAE